MSRRTQVALSVRQPWAWALVDGRKDVENRTWMPSYTGRLWIHASRKPVDEADLAWLRETLPHVSIPTAFPVGALVGYVTLVECKIDSPSIWYRPGHYAWIVRDAVALREPVAMRGRQGIWAIDEDDL